MTDTLKIVFSKTLEKSVWHNTHLATGDISEEVLKLKKTKRRRYHRLRWQQFRFESDQAKSD